MGNIASWVWVLIPLGAFVLAAYRTKVGAERQGAGEGLDGQRQVNLLSSENEKLSRQILRLEERIAVLERIATDQPSRLSAEIENLR
jgi:hypothetical protein